MSEKEKFFKLADKINKVKEIIYPEINIKNPNKDSPTEKNSKLALPIYRNLNGDAIKITLKYIYEEVLTGIFVKIENNKIKEYVEIYNFELEHVKNNESYNKSLGNKWSERIKMPINVRNWNEYAKVKSRITKGRFTQLDEIKERWTANNCLIRNEKQWTSIDSEYYAPLYDMIKDVCSHKKVGDSIFFLNKKDFPILKNDYTQPFEQIYDSNSFPLESTYKDRSFIPVLSQSTTINFADIPIPTTDDWQHLSQSKSPYTGHIKKIEWQNKISTAFFRGKGTGCGLTIETNPRFKLTYLSQMWEKDLNHNKDNSVDGVPFLDAGIISYVFRDKKIINNPYLEYTNPNSLNLKLKERVPITEQNKYKYLINVEGNSAAYRLGFMFSLESVVLHVDSKYKVWFEHLLVPYENYIPVKADLSNLGEIIKWCKMNDDKCEQIAKNGRDLYKKIMNKEYVYEFVANILNEISYKYSSSQSGGNVSNQYAKYKETRKRIEKIDLELESIPSTLDTNVAIIVPYRNNKYQSRDKQLAMFIEYYHNYLPNCDIYIIEQSDDNKKFNRGALLNIGFKIAQKSPNTINYIFSDVDLVSPPEIKKVYTHISKYPIHIASLWKEKYTFKDFLGGIISFDEKSYEKINGFPNKFFGWGGEDDAMYNRLVENNIPVYNITSSTSTSPTIKEMTHQNTSEIEQLTNKNKKFNILNDLDYWKRDGINSIKYKINDEQILKYKNVIKYNVDILI